MSDTYAPTFRPRLRRLEAQPLEFQGRRYVVLKDHNLDPYQLGQMAFIPMEAAPILMMLDGQMTMEEIVARLTRDMGEPFPMEILQTLVRDLDHGCLLATPRYLEARGELETKFKAALLRPPQLALSGAYPTDVEPCIEQLRTMLSHAPAVSNGRRLRGLMAPHIDFNRGKLGYAHAYSALHPDHAPDTYVVIGVSHWPTRHHFSLTRKGYDTPLGSIESDVEFVDYLLEGSDENLLEDEIVHRTEHSIEFQAVFLRHLHGSQKIRMVPVLVGSFHELVEAGKSPDSVPAIRRFIERLRSAEKDLKRRVCLIAGIDLAHVGQGFGDPEMPDDDFMKWLEEEDRRSLEAASQRDAEAWYRSIEGDKDRRRICGLSATWTFLSALGEGRPGRLLHYEQCRHLPTEWVTIGSMAWDDGEI